MIVSMKKFVNATEKEVNDFLATIDAKNIVNVGFNVVGFEGNSDEFVTIFYKQIYVENVSQEILDRIMEERMGAFCGKDESYCEVEEEEQR